jgi:hypothetical protein
VEYAHGTRQKNDPITSSHELFQNREKRENRTKQGEQKRESRTRKHGSQTPLTALRRVLVDGEIILELSVGFEVTSLVRGVSVDDVGAVVLELSEGEEDDVAGGDPDLGV